MAFYLHRSNRTERLVDVLAEIARQPLASPLLPECIVVSSPGMERWLSMQLAQRVGVWANPQFPFPRKLIDTLLALAVPVGAEQRDGYEATCMLFGIARELGLHAADPRFAEPARYCEHDAHARRRLLLAQRLAELFDQYLSYRPDLVLEWASGGGEGFQPALFRALMARLGDGHLALTARKAIAALAAGAPLADWPERIHLFGLSSMPPLYLDLLSALAQAHDVHLYVLAPSREYFADLRPTRGKRARASLKRQLSFEDPSFQPEAHPLLASFGRHAREFQELLETVSYREQGDLFEEPGESCLLHVLQSDLLGLRMRDEPGGAARHVLAPDDASFAIHACHSPMREIEVLHDQLSYLIAERDVEPSQIIVMTPNIGEYAKVIDAVFSQAEPQRAPIPFRIADRGVVETQPLFLALTAVLDVLAGRFGANEVLDLLGFDAIREHFGIAVEQLDELRGWLEASGIRWGVDAEHRAEYEQPACSDNTWQNGLGRLALGYSTGLPADALFEGHSPVTIANEHAELLGCFLDFCHSLFEQRRELVTPASMDVWATRVAELTRVMLGDRAEPAEQKQLLRALHELSAQAERAGFAEAFDLISLRRLLERALGASVPTQGFLSSGVTFCQMLPMRSIPFEVVCLLGLNDGVFPASETPLAFDLMHKTRRPGDRSRKDDDRQLLLEALLSARQKLLISFVGQSQQTGKELPASVLVYEFIEHAARSCQLPGQAADLSQLARRDAMEKRLLLRHPLSNASPRYFGADADPRLFSYARDSCAAAQAQQSSGRSQALGRFGIVRERRAERPAEVALHELERCLMRPAREFCQRRLNLYLGDDLHALPEREPFALNQLEAWQIGNEWLENLARGRPEASRFDVERARGRLPLFVPGERVYEKLQADVSAIAALLAQYSGEGPARALEVDLNVAGVRLVGSIGEVWPRAHVRTQYSLLGRRHELRQFVRQVVLRCLAERDPGLGVPETSLLIGRKSGGGVGVVRFALQAPAWPLLEELIALHCESLSAPLPLFAFASRGYAEQWRAKGDAAEALRHARNKFGDRQNLGERETDLSDEYVQQLFGDFEQMHARSAGAFEAAALRLYGPLLEARQER